MYIYTIHTILCIHTQFCVYIHNSMYTYIIHTQFCVYRQYMHNSVYIYTVPCIHTQYTHNSVYTYTIHTQFCVYIHNTPTSPCIHTQHTHNSVYIYTIHTQFHVYIVYLETLWNMEPRNSCFDKGEGRFWSRGLKTTKNSYLLHKQILWPRPGEDVSKSKLQYLYKQRLAPKYRWVWQMWSNLPKWEAKLGQHTHIVNSRICHLC